MSTARKPENQGPIQQKVYHVMDTLDQLLLTLTKNKDVPTLQQDVDNSAEELMSIMSKHSKEIGKYTSYLKNAIIDLTEVPQMQPQMQKVAFQEAIKAAKKNLQTFLDNTSL